MSWKQLSSIWIALILYLFTPQQFYTLNTGDAMHLKFSCGNWTPVNAICHRPFRSQPLLDTISSIKLIRNWFKELKELNCKCDESHLLTAINLFIFRVFNLIMKPAHLTFFVKFHWNLWVIFCGAEYELTNKQPTNVILAQCLKVKHFPVQIFDSPKQVALPTWNIYQRLTVNAVVKWLHSTYDLWPHELNKILQ